MGLLLYIFIGYPLFFIGVAFFMKQKSKNNHVKCTPSVSIILSVYNEERVIRKKIANFLALDYPKDLSELIIVSDCSTDSTDKIIKKYVNKRIRLVRQNIRNGKSVSLNTAVPYSKGEILVFTDANAMFKKNVLRKLTRHFSNNQIGLVSGRTEYIASELNKHTSVVRLYWWLENFIKKMENQVGSIVGADGAIYAMRKTIYNQLNACHLNDFIHTFETILIGYKAIIDDGAVSWEEAPKTLESEYKRQIRIVGPCLLVFFSQFPRLLMKRKLFYVFQIISHKFLRWNILLVLITLFISNFFIIEKGLPYQFIFTFQFIFLLFSVIGYMCRNKTNQSVLFFYPYSFLVMQVAALVGFIRAVTGRVESTWESQR